MMFTQKTFLITGALCALALLGSCAPATEEDSSSRYLYVASGICVAGGNTTFSTTTASNVIFRIRLENGHYQGKITDFNTSYGDSPVSITPYDGNYFLALLEKTGSRRIEKIEKRLDGLRAPFNADAGTGLPLSNTLLAMTPSTDGGVFVSRSNGVGLINSAGVTQMNSFMGTTGGDPACGTTHTKISTLATTNMGHLIYMNSENNDNKLAIIRSGPTCLAGQSGPVAAALSTVAVWLPTANQILAFYSGTTTATDMNSLYAYDVTETATTATLSSGTKVYDANLFPGTYNYLLYAVSAMAFDSLSNTLYVASSNQAATNIATSGNYVIEKFTYDPSTKKISRVGNMPFFASTSETKCISSMFIGE